MRSRRIHLAAAAASLTATLGLAACGGSTLSAASTCHDFMNADATTQHEAVDRLAAQYSKPDYATPLGEPEVPYFCSANPSVTLGSFFARAEG
jgi:hypothetical protein